MWITGAAPQENPNNSCKFWIIEVKFHRSSKSNSSLMNQDLPGSFSRHALQPLSFNKQEINTTSNKISKNKIKGKTGKHIEVLNCVVRFSNELTDIIHNKWNISQLMNFKNLPTDIDVFQIVTIGLGPCYYLTMSRWTINP